MKKYLLFKLRFKKKIPNTKKISNTVPLRKSLLGLGNLTLRKVTEFYVKSLMTVFFSLINGASEKYYVSTVRIS